MDKKELYEHLAKIYLDASSSKKKKRSKPQSKISRPPFLLSAFLVFGLASALFVSSKNKWPNFAYHKNLFASQTALVLLSDAAKINFNFDPVKKEVFSLNLSKLNLNPYKELIFSIKKASSCPDKINLKVEFTNAYQEKSEIYINDIALKWQNHKIKLSEFKNISDWSRITDLTFTVEEWNAKAQHGIVYLDNVKLLK